MLSDSQLATLAELGDEHTADVGDVLYRVGDQRYPFIAIVEGEVAIVDAAGQEIIRHGPSRFLGELNLLSGQTVFVTAVVTQPLRYIAVDRDVMRELLFDDGPLSDLVLLHVHRQARGAADGRGAGPADRRPALVRRDDADARLRAQQPPAVHLARRGARRGRRAARAPAWWRGAARALAGPGVARARHRPRARAARGGRPAGRRRGPGGTRRSRVRRLGGARHARRREHRARRTGGLVAQDRELPRLPRRHHRHRAHQPRRHPGAQVRCAAGDALPGGRARARRRAPRRAPRGGPRDRGARRAPRHRRGIPASARRRSRRLRGTQRLLRRRASGGAAVRRLARRASSAAATRPARPPSGWRAAARS